MRFVRNSTKTHSCAVYTAFAHAMFPRHRNVKSASQETSKLRGTIMDIQPTETTGTPNNYRSKTLTAVMR